MICSRKVLYFIQKVSSRILFKQHFFSTWDFVFRQISIRSLYWTMVSLYSSLKLSSQKLSILFCVADSSSSSSFCFPKSEKTHSCLYTIKLTLIISWNVFCYQFKLRFWIIAYTWIFILRKRFLPMLFNRPESQNQSGRMWIMQPSSQIFGFCFDWEIYWRRNQKRSHIAMQSPSSCHWKRGRWILLYVLLTTCSL